MVDVTSEVLSGTSVYHHIIFNFKQILSTFLIRLSVREAWTEILYNELTSRNELLGEETETGNTLFYFKLELCFFRYF